MMKICTKCKKLKFEREYSTRNKKRGRLNPWCRACISQYDKDAWSNPEKRKIKQKKIKARKNIIRQFFYELLLGYKCCECGESDPVTLDFDHVNPSEKLATVSNMVRWGFSKENIILEIEKCEVRCANCHRKRTAKQFKWYQGVTQPGRDLALEARSR